MTAGGHQTMMERLQEIPTWVILVYLGLMGATVLWLARERLRAVRERRDELRRIRREMGFSWAWREFWFAPRQRKLPPPRRPSE
jgi:hypothetical protein